MSEIVKVKSGSKYETLNSYSRVVVAGDTFWDLAKQAYGDGAKWRLISGANKEFRPRRLPVGATLTIPPAN